MNKQSMRPRSIARLAALWIALSAAPSGAQTVSLPARFDLKPSGVTPRPGYTAVGPNTLFSSNGNFGLSANAVDALIGSGPGHDVVERDDEERLLFAGCVRVASGTEFHVLLPPFTKVRARCVLAQVPPFTPALASSDAYDFQVSASKGSVLAQVADDIDLRTPYLKVNLSTDSGSYRKLWFSATSDATGLLRIRFSGPTIVPVAAVELYGFEAAPIRYQRIGATWLQGPAGPAVPGLAAFHAHDYQSAYAQFLSIADPLVRANAFLWLAGWLEGSPDGFPGALNQAQIALSSPSLANSARAIEFRDQLEDFRFAELHFALRLYSIGGAPPPHGLGYFNTSLPGTVLANPLFGFSDLERHDYLAETLYRQISGASLAPIVNKNAGAHPDPDYEVPPLAFRALDRIASIHHGHNSNHSIGPSALENVEIFEGIWRSMDVGGFLVGEFAADMQAAVMSYMTRPEVHQHTKAGGLPSHWNAVDVPTSYLDPAKAWWDALLGDDGSVPASAPSWAKLERSLFQAAHGAASWWLSEREINGEFGGGAGDDPELVPVLMIPFFSIRSAADEDKLEAILRASDVVLNGGSVQDGYYSGALVDVEHSAEFTSYPLFTALTLHPGDPLYLQRCLDVAKHMTYPGQPQKAWCTPDLGGDLRFRSYYFNTFGPADTSVPEFANKGVDVPLTGRALMPSLLYQNHSKNSALEADFASWAAGWRDAALAPSASRPLGLVPAAVRGSDLAEGFAGNWWQADVTAYSYPNNLLHLEHIYASAFLGAYRQGGPQAHTFLLPTLRLLQGLITLKKQIDAGTPPGDLNTVGSANWARNQILLSSTFPAILALVRPTLLSDPVLLTTDDPDLPSTAPYVTQAFADDLDLLLNDVDAGYQTYLTTPQEFLTSTGTWNNKQKGGLLLPVTRAGGWLRNYFPLATSAVRYTDRAYLYFQGAQKTLFGMLTGGHFGSPLPSHIVTWEPVASDPATLDIAVLVNDFATVSGTGQHRLRLLAFNFETSPREVGFRLWNRLPLGRYHLRHGAASNSTDYFTGSSVQSNVDFVHRGQLFSAPLPAQTLTLIELERFADVPGGTTGGFDLAMSPSTAALSFVTGGPVGVNLRIEQPVYNTGDLTAPAGSMQLFAALLDPSGQPIPLDASGALELLIPLTANNPGIPAPSGFQLSSAPVHLDLPLLAPLIQLWLLDFTISLRFEANAPLDFDESNDRVTVLIDLPTLLALL